MSILEETSKMFSVDVKQPPATEEEIKALQGFSPIEVHSDYLELVRQATEVEIKVNNEKYIRIWSPSGCIEMNESYNIQTYLPRSLAIGDDEGGGALIYLRGNEGFGIYLCRFADLDINEATKIAPSLKDLLVDDVGIDKLL